jgi:hypothetical protein
MFEVTWNTETVRWSGQVVTWRTPGTFFSVVQTSATYTTEVTHIWWLSQYLYRRQLRIVAPFDEDVAAGHPVRVNLPSILIKNRKVRSDLEDLEVVYVEGASITHLGRAVLLHSDNTIDVFFNLVKGMDAGDFVEGEYYIYYGNLFLEAQPIRPTIVPDDVIFPSLELTEQYDFNNWPAQLQFDSPRVSYTRPGEHWRDGRSTVPNSRVNILLNAFSLRIISEVGPDQGILEVQIDGQPWEEVDLFSPIVEVKPVYTTYGLSSSLHELVLRSSGRSNPSSFGEEVNLQEIEYYKSVIGFDMGENVVSLFWKTAAGSGNE